MRVLLALILLPVPALAPASADVRPLHKADCSVRQEVVPAAGNLDGLQRLDRLPAAKMFLTVYREVDRCPAPIIVRYGIGTSGR